MNYYLIEITTYNDGTKDSVGVYTYDNVDSAVASFHKKMGGMMTNAVVDSELLNIMAGDGYSVRCEKWVRHTDESTD